MDVELRRLPQGEKPALNLPPWANSGIFTQDSWQGNFVRTLLMGKSFYLLRFHTIGFGLQLREHFPKSFKGGGGKGGFKVVVLREIRLLPCKMVLIKSPGGSIGKHYKQNRGQSYSF